MHDRDSRLADSLLDPAVYPWRPDRVERIVTHVSLVFLAGDRVVKVKRAVDLGFVDHRSPEARERSCRDEVRLNRRLADGVYLGVEPLVATADGIRLGVSGAPLEWAVVMRRLPADRMLDRLLREGLPRPGLSDALADRLIPFHRTARPCGPADPGACAASQAAVLIDNLDALRSLPPGLTDASLLSRVDAAMRPLLDPADGNLAARCRDGWVREGHGDLRAEHVCLEPGHPPQVYDCVEFDLGLRCADIASDLAFLLMDLRRLGAGDVADGLLARYSAAGFDLPDWAIRLYMAHRALVRSKVGGIETAEGIGERDALLRDAADHLDLAAGAALALSPCLLIVSGLSGAGKSTVARRVSRAFGVSVHRSDQIRQDLAGKGVTPGKYAPETTVRVHRALLARAARDLASGTPTLLDATFLDDRWRTAADETARAAGVPLVVVDVTCTEATALARLRARAAAGDSVSDADVAVYRRQAARLAAEPPSVPDGALHAEVANDDAEPPSLDPLVEALDAAGLLSSAIRPD